METQLRFAPDILIRLGEELVPHADLGVMELVRNAYDADALNCTLHLIDADAPAGTLVVSDDGDGMTAEQLARGFLLIGKSAKTADPTTPTGRRKVGEKGLGRIAALRLGTEVEIRTRSRTQPGVEHTLSIDWKVVDSAEAVEDVRFSISSRPTELDHGTDVEVRDLRQALTDADAERLARALLLLSGPFKQDTKFQVSCDAPGFSALSDLLGDPPLQWCEYRLVADLDDHGYVSATLYNWRGEPEFKAGHEKVAVNRRGRSQEVLPLDAPRAQLELWMFNLNPKASKEPRFADQDTVLLRRWLRQVGGIHLYHHGLRVQPYGDQGNDWLGINLSRVSSPELRPSTNTSVGRIRVEDPLGRLVPKTDRSGFVDNQAFADLQAFAKYALDWAANQRLQKREQKRSGAAKRARDKRREAEDKFNQMVKAIQPDPDTPTLEIGDTALLEQLSDSAIELVEALQEENRVQHEDLTLYRNMATVGTSTAVFAHEALRPAKRIITELQTIARRARKWTSDEIYEEHLSESVDATRESALTLETFAQLPLSLVRKKKREPGPVEIDRTCEGVVRLFARYLEEREISVEFDLDTDGTPVHTTVADMESIVSNLLANAAHAFTRRDAPDRDRLIRIRTRCEDHFEKPGIALYVDDTGPGIRGISLGLIWLPGKSTRDNGTGLGLTIVRDVVADLGGTQAAEENGALGGAGFRIWLPSKAGEDSPA
ncbi:sensor histidine kinase [Actinomadura geliboluensis]|uniref:sensor histidine kinase n=1 Tax=Actinomadura geliboluensis TaxID=882440 RepID=UPI00370FCC26